MTINLNLSKEMAAKAAINFINSNHVIGVGSGSTVYYFLKLLAKENFKELKLVPTSIDTEHLIHKFLSDKVEIIDIPTTGIDITIDGADRVNPQKQSIKGGGAALMREKVVMSRSKKSILIVDETKIVEELGGFPIAVEILQFGWKSTLAELSKFGQSTTLRASKSKLGPVITDNGNFIADINLGTQKIHSQEVSKIEQEINHIPGVLENGLFGKPVTKLIIGYLDEIKII